ncbi:BON domain-containing protein [Paraburkholderia caledonica]|uniref:BON domain-containing protein n=1 Tax=Paraburkholderia caledonica TaxID=134536 RepID=UPI000481F0CE|nr:BON domain-containing protein [Paraburkholderia caledonica]
MAHSGFPNPDSAVADGAGGARLSDEQIGEEATRRLAWDAAVPERTVTVEVRDGRIVLNGELEHDAQRIAALEDVTRLFGVAGVCDRLVVKHP